MFKALKSCIIYKKRLVLERFIWKKTKLKHRCTRHIITELFPYYYTFLPVSQAYLEPRQISVTEIFDGVLKKSPW